MQTKNELPLATTWIFYLKATFELKPGKKWMNKIFLLFQKFQKETKLLYLARESIRLVIFSIFDLLSSHMRFDSEQIVSTF